MSRDGSEVSFHSGFGTVITGAALTTDSSGPALAERLVRDIQGRPEIEMHIGRPIYFEDKQAQPTNRVRFQLASALFALLAIAGPIVLARLMATPPEGEVPAFIGP